MFAHGILLASTRAQLDRELITVLLQLVVIITAARVAATLVRWIKQPVVIGELAAGLILGPSCLGRLFPTISKTIFDPAVADTFAVLSELGLILLLFLIGLEFEFGHVRSHGAAALAVALIGIAAPFALGAGLGALMYSHVESPHGGGVLPYSGFVLFMGTAMSITAIPVLGRLMMELNITRTRIGAVAMTAAAIEDACGWILLAAISSFVKSDFRVWESVRMFLATTGFFLFLMFVARPLLKAFVRFALRSGKGELGLNSVAVILVVLLLAALATSLIGIYAIFGAFLLGVVLSDEERFRAVIARHLRDFLTVFFLPIFFTYTGLRTDIGTLTGAMHWVMLLAIIACAVAGKLGACGIAARLSGFSSRDAFCVGALMNTRGLMELIVITIGRDLGVIPDSVFCMLVLMALATTIMTTPLVLRFRHGTELEPLMNESEFVRGVRRHGADDEE